MDVVYVLFFEAGNYLFLTFWDVIFERGVDSVSGRRDDVKDDNDVYKVYKLKYMSPPFCSAIRSISHSRISAALYEICK